MKTTILFLFAFLFVSAQARAQAQPTAQSLWPPIPKEAKPYSRWWWMGSAVDEPNLTEQIAKYNDAGFGGLEITPIYGAVGFENAYLPYLSPSLMKMLDVSVRETAKHGMGIDMNLGTGWPFGGPQVTPEAAASKLILEKYSLKKGEKLPQKIQPSDPKQQSKNVILQAVTSYSASGKITDLTTIFSADGTLLQQAGTAGNELQPATEDQEIYAAFCGKTLQKVKRAAPGADGYTFDHFSKSAFNTYVARYDSAFQNSNHGVQTFFNDSYEVYGTNWTPTLFEQFQQRRGYSLRPYLRELAEKKPSTELAKRIHCDYRETISDLLLENFTRSFTAWAHSKGSQTRNQAHGSPGNLLDLYGAVDIPECETFGSTTFPIPGLRRDTADVLKDEPDPIMLKFASSAAHVTGKKLVSSETFTWLTEHFRTALSQCKPEVEQAFLSGINHVFYHGTAYSPKEAAWPGWLFYASTEFTTTNSFWPHLSGLNNYIARCQSILQSGQPKNDLLVYWPVHDVWMQPDKTDLMLTIHSVDRWLLPTPFYKNVQEWMKKGFSVDFVSDLQLTALTKAPQPLTTPAGNSYRTLIVPECTYLSEKTLQNILAIASQGATVIFQKFPVDVPGQHNLKARQTAFQNLLKSLSFIQTTVEVKSAKVGKGEVLLCAKVESTLAWKRIAPEKLTATGLKYIKRQSAQGFWYYLVNHTTLPVDQFLLLNEKGAGYLLLDPQTGTTGLAQTKSAYGVNYSRVQLRPGEAMFVLVSAQPVAAEAWKYLEKPLATQEIGGPWKLQFTEGGAKLPAATQLQQLLSWTELPDSAARNFSGTGRYSATFEVKDLNAGEYLLDLGTVRESARVWINGQDAGILWSIPFTVRIKSLLKVGINTIDIEVANLMANRIRQMDQQKISWRNYHEINFVNIKYKPFDSSNREPMVSGLLGPVRIIAFN